MKELNGTEICFSFNVESGRIIQADMGLQAQTGLTEPELRARSFFELIDQSDLSRFRRALADIQTAGRAVWLCHLSAGATLSDFLHCDASLRSDGVTAYVIASPHQLADVLKKATSQPVSALSESAGENLSELMHCFVTDQLYELSVSHEAVLDRDGTVLAANPHFCSAYCTDEGRTVGYSIHSLMHIDRESPLCEAIARMEPDAVAADQIVTVGAESNERSLLVRLVCARDGSAIFFVGHDVTQEQRLNAQLINRATTDQLTKLANREYFDQALDDTIAAGDSAALVMLDLDNFKQVNDALGHSVGDELLTTVGRRISSVVRKEDIVARFGGDEFMVMLRGVAHAEEAERVAEKIRLALSLPCLIGGRKLHVTSSIGVALSSERTRDAAMLFHQADAAVYEAKNLGRNRAVIHDHKLEQVLEHQSEIERELRAALTSNGIEPFVQGIHTTDGVLCGVEVLVRLRAEDGSIKGPGAFLEVARQLGLLAKVGEQVFDRALAQLTPWLDANPELTVSLNADPREIMAPGFARMFRRIVNRHGVAPRQIYLEVTETGFLSAGGIGGEVLGELRELGLKVAIDDFGTGASSLGYLRDLAIDRIKIDRTFVTNLHLNPSNATITDTVIKLGVALGMNVVAEGVESQRELDHLIGLGSPLVQGYLMHKPESITTFLEKHSTLSRVISG